MLLPWRTDAPLYHRPWGTIGLIAANALVFLWALGARAGQMGPLLLHYGTFNPIQWVTSVFVHGSWSHLIGNMFFLWVFGLIVEGKTGTKRFLAIYGGIAVASCLIEQVLMLGAEGASFGASGIVFGLLAIALVWAPENEVDCLLILGFWIRTLELRVITIAVLYGVFQAIEIGLSGLHVSSGLLHLLGAATGLPVAIVMLRRDWVDCEGWDWFSRRKERQTRSSKAASKGGMRTVG